MQTKLDGIKNDCTCFRLTISIKKTNVSYTPACGDLYVEHYIFVYKKRFEIVKKFAYRE